MSLIDTRQGRLHIIKCFLQRLYRGRKVRLFQIACSGIHIAKNLMQSQIWGIKTFYYSLINKQGAKSQAESVDDDNVIMLNFNTVDELEDDCESCKL